MSLNILIFVNVSDCDEICSFRDITWFVRGVALNKNINFMAYISLRHTSELLVEYGFILSYAGLIRTKKKTCYMQPQKNLIEVLEEFRR
jgi:hypothetical protein